MLEDLFQEMRRRHYKILYMAPARCNWLGQFSFIFNHIILIGDNNLFCKTQIKDICFPLHFFRYYFHSNPIQIGIIKNSIQFKNFLILIGWLMVFWAFLLFILNSHTEKHFQIVCVTSFSYFFVFLYISWIWNSRLVGLHKMVM